mgnify:CR=1 FL=1
MKRTGGTNNSCYRVVVMDQCAQRDGKAIEEIGVDNIYAKEYMLMKAFLKKIKMTKKLKKQKQK